MAADVGSTLASWSTTEGSNLPVGATSVSQNLDDNFRMIQAVVRTLAASSTIASATTTDLSTVNEKFITVTGTTTITGLGTLSAGMEKVLVFAGALTFTHNATSLILPGAANITTAAGDTAHVLSLGSGNWRCLSYQPAAGYQGKDATLTSIAALGTAADKMAYTTGVDTWAETALTAAARTVLDDATTGAMLTTLGGAALAGSATQDFATKIITPAGLVDISGASAGQIKFPASQNASADANTLDDYEETNSFSPTIYGTGTAGTGTYTTQTGRCTKIGRLVHCSVGLVWTAHTGAGNIGIGNLPYTCATTSTGGYRSTAVECANLTVPASQFVAGAVVSGTTTMLVYSVAAAGNVWSNLALDTAASLYIDFWYEASN